MPVRLPSNGTIFVAILNVPKLVDMFFTGKSTIFRVKNDRLLDSLFSRGLLCMCVFCIVNTLFVVIIKRPSTKLTPPAVKKHMQIVQQVNPVMQPSVKGKSKVFSKSLLRIILEKCLNVSDRTSIPGTEADDEIKKVEYISQVNGCSLYIPDALSQIGIRHSPPIISNTFLDTLTPPPKRLV